MSHKEDDDDESDNVIAIDASPVPHGFFPPHTGENSLLAWCEAGAQRAMDTILSAVAQKNRMCT